MLFDLIKQLIISILIIIVKNVNGQYFEPIHFTIEDGLPSSTVFNCIEDNKGFMWFATETGISRFDGKFFDIFNVKDGFNSNTILEIDKDSKGRLWITPIAGDLSVFENGIWKGSQDYPLLKEPFGPDFNRPSLICINEYTLAIYGNHILLIYFNKKNEMLVQKHFNVLNDQNDIKVGIILQKNKIILKTLKQNIEIPTPENLFNIEIMRNPYFYLNNKFYYSSSITNPRINFKVRGIKNEIVRKIINSNGKLYISSNQGILECFKINDTLYQRNKTILEGKDITNMYVDSRGNIWACSNIDGVYLLPKQIGNNYYLKDLEGDFLFQTIFNHNKYKTISKNGKQFEFYNSKFYIRNDNKMLTYGYDTYFDDDYVLLSNKLLRNNKDINVYNWNKSLTYNPYNESIILGTGINIIEIFKDNSFKILEVNNSRNYSVLPLSKNEYLIGSDIGVQFLKNNKLSTFELGIHSKIKNITDIELGNDSTIVILASNYGVLIKNNSEYVLLQENKHLISEAKCILAIDKNIILIGTQKGLNIVKYKTKPLLITEITSLTKYCGMNEDNINNLNFNKKLNEVIITYNKGFQTIKIDEINDLKLNAHVYIKYLKSNDSIYYNFDYLKLKSFENNIEINFGSIDYNFESNNGYSYILEFNGIKGEKNITKSSLIRFSNLLPGKYKLIIAFVNPYSNNIKNQKIIEFVIVPEFWQTNWFRILMLIGLIGVILLFIVFYLKSARKKLENKAALQMKISDLELEAQKSRLKPHFIFNSLNSIQSYINQNELDLANDYLVNFSKLMRQSLDLSNNDITTIKQEFEFTKRYIEMEQVRFQNKFEFEISLNEMLAEKKIPSMILQTFVENSINHGLRYKENGKGFLRLETKLKDENNFEIIISDNGIGVEKSKEYRKKGHESKGVSIIYQRIHFFNSKYNVDIDIKESTNENNITEVGHVVKLQFKNYNL